MIDKEKDLRISELLKKVATISKNMPEIIFTYFSTFETSKQLRPFYNLFSESFLSLFSFSFLYLNQAWSQASALLRTSIEQVSKIVVLCNNKELIEDFIELKKISEVFYNLPSKEEKDEFLESYNNDINVFNNYIEYGWAQPLIEGREPTRNDVIKLAKLGETIVDIKNQLNGFVHGNMSIFDFYSQSEKTEVMKRFGRRISLICCKLFYLSYLSFKNRGSVKDISLDTDDGFIEFKDKYKYLVENY